MSGNENTREEIMVFVLIGGLSVIGKTSDPTFKLRYVEIADPMIIGQQTNQGVMFIPFAPFSETQKVTIRPGMLVINPYKPVSKLTNAYLQVLANYKLEKAGLVLTTELAHLQI